MVIWQGGIDLRNTMEESGGDMIDVGRKCPTYD